MGVSASAISRVTGVDVTFKNFNSGRAQMLPQRLAIIGVGNDNADYALTKYEIGGSASTVAEKYGWGSPLHLAARQFFPIAGAAAEFPVTVYPLAKAENSVPAAGSIGAVGTVTANGSGTVYIGGVAAEFAGLKGSLAGDVLTAIKAAIDGVLEMPVVTGDIADEELPLTSKWSGESSNMITLEIEADVPGITFSLTDFSGGAIDPVIDTALAKIGGIWETMVLDTFDYKKTSRLDTYQVFGDGRWAVLEKKPALIAHGCTDDLETRTAISDLRKTDYINFLIVSVESRELPFVVAAKGLINDIMTTANKNPPLNYKGLLTGLHCGDDSLQENYTQRNASVGKGASTNIKNGSVAELNDIITFYHPEADGKYPSKRYVVDMVKLQNIVYNVRLIMEADEIKGAPLVSDKDITVNPTAIAPKTIKTSFINLANSLQLNALIADAAFTKKNLVVELDSENPKRVNTRFPVKLSGNLEVSSNEIYFGFFLGGS
jgi:phage tail sheath gpL-like